MSCAKSKIGSGNNPDYIDYISFINNKRLRLNKSSINCRKGFLPSFTPTLGSLSVTSSAEKAYSLVYVYGANFLPNGTTFIKFGGWGYYPATFYSSYNLSFVVPGSAPPGNYPVQVINLYNSNFSPPVNQTYTGNLNFSNSITYTIT